MSSITRRSRKENKRNSSDSSRSTLRMAIWTVSQTMVARPIHRRGTKMVEGKRREEQWEEVEAPTFPPLKIFEQDESVIAIYVQTRHGTTNFGKQKFHDMKGQDGNLFTLPGSFDVNVKLKTVEPGTRVRITYLGQEEMKGSNGKTLFTEEGTAKTVKRFRILIPKGVSRREPEETEDSDIPF